jgi:hypothetical protein
MVLKRPQPPTVDVAERGYDKHHIVWYPGDRRSAAATAVRLEQVSVSSLHPANG